MQTATQETTQQPFVDAEVVGDAEPEQEQSLAKVENVGALSFNLDADHLRQEMERQEARRNVLEEFVRRSLKPGHHYYSFNKDAKPVLTKDGSYRIFALFGVTPGDPVLEKERADGHLTVTAKIPLYHTETGKYITTGVGSCSTRESKYAYRKGERVCPECKVPAIRKSKDKDEFYCWSKLDGCGAKFAGTDDRITGQQLGRVENPDIADQENTVLKMATKRAEVAGAQKLPGVSELFTQDLGDVEHENLNGGSQRSHSSSSAPTPTHSGPAKQSGTQVEVAKTLARKLIDSGCEPEDLAVQFLPEGVAKFSLLSEEQAAGVIEPMSELLNAQIKKNKSSSSASIV